MLNSKEIIQINRSFTKKLPSPNLGFLLKNVIFDVHSLETWYFMALILFAGYLENAEVSVDALSVW